MGAASDLEGNYVILNVPPGIYTVKASMIGYQALRYTNIQIQVDLTTRVDFDLSVQVLEAGEAVTVEAERKMVIKDLTASASHVSSDEMEMMPVETFDEVLNLQAGVVNGHFRGGRSGETLYMIDGIPVTDSYEGNISVEVENAAIQELQLITGAFNAEYGNAMSAVVNIVTKDGDNQFSGNSKIYFGDYVSNHDDVFNNVDALSPSSIQNYEMSINGPLIRDKLFYFLTTRYYEHEGYYFGKDTYKPFNNADFSSNDPEKWILFQPDSVDNDNDGIYDNVIYPGMGDNSYVPMNPFRKWSGQLKLTYRFSPQIKISYNFVGDNFINYILDKLDLNSFLGVTRMKWRDYDHAYKFNPDGDMDRFKTGLSHSINLTHQLSGKTYYTMSFSRFSYDYKEYVFEDPSDLRYLWSTFTGDTPLFSFNTGGVKNRNFQRTTQTSILKTDLTSQVNNLHQIRTGFEFKYDNIHYNNRWFDVHTGRANKEVYRTHPWQFSTYVQDKMEFSDLIVNVGLRLDYFNPKGRVPNDSRDPDLSDPIRSDPDSVSWWKDTKPKFKLSPRIGLGYPISDRGVIHVSYGHFFQIPSYNLLYNNYYYRMSTGTGLSTLFGNADLKPEQTVSYEIGLQQQLTEDFAINADFYFRDIRNLVSSDRIVLTYAQQPYAQYVNRDYGNVRGVIVSLSKRHSEYYSFAIDYTYQIAEGNASDPASVFHDVQANREPEKQLVHLDWDQRHTLNVSVNVGNPGNWMVSWLLQYGSGLPYTPTQQGIQTTVENGGRRPSNMNIDFKAYRIISILGFKPSVYVKINNLLDRLNETNVYSDTGRATYTLAAQRALITNPAQRINSIDEYYTNPTYYSAPRRVTIGIELGF